MGVVVTWVLKTEVLYAALRQTKYSGSAVTSIHKTHTHATYLQKVVVMMLKQTATLMVIHMHWDKFSTSSALE